MSDFNEKCKDFLFELGKKRKYNIITVSQSIKDLKKPDMIVVKRSYGHRFMSNNWLKLHGKPMRRKPFKKRPQPLLDEARTILGQHDSGRPFDFDKFRNHIRKQ